MGILDSFIAEQKDYIGVMAAVELLASSTKDNIGNVAKYLLGVNFSSEVPLYKKNDYQQIVHYDGTDYGVYANTSEVLHVIHGKYAFDARLSASDLSDEDLAQRYWKKVDFYNFEPIKALNSTDSIKKISRDVIDQILVRTDLVELINSHIPLKKAGKNYIACCPFHQEKSPSFSVSRELGKYHCFGCSASGNAIAFLMEYERRDFLDVTKDLAQRAGVDLLKQETYLVVPKNGDTEDGHTVGHATQQDYQKQRDQLQAENDNLKARIAELETQSNATVSATDMDKITLQDSDLLLISILMNMLKSAKSAYTQNKILQTIENNHSPYKGLSKSRTDKILAKANKIHKSLKDKEMQQQ